MARCTVEADAAVGLRGVMRGKVVRTTTSDSKAPCPLDRVNRQFKADRPNQLWVSDHLRFDLAGLVVCGLRHRRVCQAHRWVACEQFDAHGLCSRCLWDKPYARQPERDGSGLVYHSDEARSTSAYLGTERLVWCLKIDRTIFDRCWSNQLPYGRLR